MMIISNVESKEYVKKLESQYPTDRHVCTHPNSEVV